MTSYTTNLGIMVVYYVVGDAGFIFSTVVRGVLADDIMQD